MHVPDFETSWAMLDRAGGVAFPAVNVSSLTTANAVLRGLAESKADRTIQISAGGAAFGSGDPPKDPVLGTISIAERVHRAAECYPVNVALRTDHCLKS